MKKFSAFALAIVFGVAISAQAFAASPIEFEGYVKVFHESLSNFTRQGEKPYDRDSFFWNKFQVDVTIKPSERAKVFWQFRGVDGGTNRWGNYGVDGSNGTVVFTRALYGELAFDWGTIRGGRLVEGLPGTVGGLASLGYAPTWGTEFLYAQVFDYNTPIDALTYDNKWDLSNGHKFGLAVYYDKLGSNILTDHADAQAWSNDNIPISKYPFFLRADGAGDDFSFKDQDYDIFGVEATYEWETGGVSLGVQYDRDLTDPTVEKDYAVYINPAFVQSFGPFAIHFEGIFGWGERTYDKAAVNPADWTGLYGIEQAYFGHEWDGTFKSRGLGLYLDGVYTYDQGDVTLSGWYVSGTDLDEKDGKSNSLVKLGDFAPFLVAFNNQTLGTGVFSDDLGSGAFDHYANDLINSSPLGGGTYNFSGFNTGLTNQWGVAILGNHTLVPDFIKMNYGIGYFRLVKPAFTWLELDDGSYMAAPFVPETDISALPVMGGRQVVGHRKQSKDLGWEIDLGFTFQIVENVWFETQFGYFFNGDAFEYFDGTGWKDPKDTFAWANVLAFDF